MYKRLVFALVERWDTTITSVPYATRSIAEAAIAYGEIKPGRPLTGGKFTGEILTYDEMASRGLLPGQGPKNGQWHR